MFKGELYRSKSNPFRIKIIDIASDNVKVQKLVDDDVKAAVIMDFKLEELMNRIQAGEWELDNNTTGKAKITLDHSSYTFSCVLNYLETSFN